MFQHCIQLGESTGVVRVRTFKTRLDTTKFVVVVTSLFNLVISSFPDMFYHAWTGLLIYHDGSNNCHTLSYNSTVTLYIFNIHGSQWHRSFNQAVSSQWRKWMLIRFHSDDAFCALLPEEKAQQRCSSLFVHQANMHEQACQQLCSR